MAQDITYIGLGDLTYKSTDDGTLMVYGVATDPTLDVDRQICDPTWLKQAMPQWFTSGANVREQHSSIAAGVGVELAADGDKWMLKSEVVDPVTQTKVRKKVLKGYSIGIKGAQVIKDDSAPNGRIVGGTIVEVSLVDRPANPSARIEIAKSVNGELTMTDIAKGGPGSGPHPGDGAKQLAESASQKSNQTVAGHNSAMESHFAIADAHQAAANEIKDNAKSEGRSLTSQEQKQVDAHEYAKDLHSQAAEAHDAAKFNLETGKPSNVTNDTSAMAAAFSRDAAQASADTNKADKPEVTKTSDLNADAIQSVDGAGDKAPDETKRSCHECYGQGEIVNPDNNERVTCPTCNGSGEEPVDSSLHHINSSSSHPGADGDDAKAHMMAAQEYSHDRSVKEVTSHVTAAMENQKAADAHRAAATSPSADGTSSAYEAYKASVNAAGRSSSADWTTHGSYLPGAKATEADLKKRAFSKTEREHAAISGQALPGGSFPIKNIQDLKNAIQSFGRAKDKDAAKSHIIARAKALGQMNLIPDNWKNTEAETEKADHNPADLESVRTALIALIKSELDEIARGEENEIPDVSELLTSLSIFLGWWDGEADEGEAPEPFATDTDDQPSGDDMAYIAMGVSPDLIKSATSAEATDEIRDELRTEIVKALGLDDSTTKAALAEAKEELTLLKAELAAVKEMAAPGGPALRQTQVQANKSGQVDQLRSEADRLRKTASQVIDTSLRNAYIEKALKLEHDADAIARN